jgi:hypothetical protein
MTDLGNKAADTMGAYPLLIDMPADEHPFRIEVYHRLDAEIKEVAGRFAELGHVGHPAGRDLSILAAEVRAKLAQLWDAMRDVEHAERAAEQR